MTISFQTKSPEPIQFTATDHTISFELTENETADDSNDYAEMTVRVDGVQLPDLTFSNLFFTSTENTITANAGIDTFEKVRVGDVVNGTDIPTDSEVTAINGDYSELTLDNAVTGTLTDTSIVVTPQLLNATLAKVRLTLSNVNNTDIRFNTSLYTYNGSLNTLNRNASNTDDLVIGDANTTNTTTRNVNVDTFLANL